MIRMEMWSFKEEKSIYSPASVILPVSFPDVLDPWFPSSRSLQRMLSAMDRLMAADFPSLRSLSPSPLTSTATSGLLDLPRSSALWDVQETDNAFNIRFEMPGESGCRQLGRMISCVAVLTCYGRSWCLSVSFAVLNT